MTFLSRYRWLVVAILALIGWLAAFQLWAVWTFAAPCDEPIALLAGAKVERDIRVRIAAPHDLQLVFLVGTRPREDAMRLVGGDETHAPSSSVPTNVSVPLRWSVADETGRVVAEREGATHGLSSYGADDLYRDLDTISLDPGAYRLKVEVLRDVPEFQGMPARVKLALPGRKVSLGWQSDVGFFGGIVNELVVLPLIILLSAILIGLAVRDRVRALRSRRSA